MLLSLGKFCLLALMDSAVVDMHAPEDTSEHTSVGNITVNQPQLILASASPRRRELLALLDVPFQVVPSADAEEGNAPLPAAVVDSLPAWSLAFNDHPTVRAWRKARAIWEEHPTAVVLGADTVVVLNDHVLNKPDDAEHARTMLAQLAGQTHTVYTGLCVCAPSHPDGLLDLETSEVTIAPLHADEIAAYVQTGEPLDKAGGYGIQGLGGILVQHVVGSYTSVVGLPLPATRHVLAAAGIAPLRDSTDAYITWLHNQQKELLPCPPTLP